jgi:hypothetical protein
MIQSLSIEAVQAAYFDPNALRDVGYRLYRIMTPKGRFYYTIEEGHVKIYTGVTTMLGMVIPKPIGLIKWMADMGYERSQAYMRERAAYGTMLHSHIEKFMISKVYDFTILPDRVKEYIAENNLVVDTEGWIGDLQQDMMAWVQFCHDYEVEPIAIELMLVHPDGYSGTIDLICKMNIAVEGEWGEVYKSGEKKGQPKLSKKVFRMTCVVDVKSTRKGTNHEEKDVQLEAYKQLVECNFPDIKIERLFNWSPKDWRGTTPTYNLNDKTDSVDMQKFYAWIRVAQLEMSKDDIYVGEITGQVRLGDDTQGLYKQSDLRTYIVNEHAKRFSEREDVL